MCAPGLAARFQLLQRSSDQLARQPLQLCCPPHKHFRKRRRLLVAAVQAPPNAHVHVNVWLSWPASTPTSSAAQASSTHCCLTHAEPDCATGAWNAPDAHLRNPLGGTCAGHLVAGAHLVDGGHAVLQPRAARPAIDRVRPARQRPPEHQALPLACIQPPPAAWAGPEFCVSVAGARRTLQGPDTLGLPGTGDKVGIVRVVSYCS